MLLGRLLAILACIAITGILAWSLIPRLYHAQPKLAARLNPEHARAINAEMPFLPDRLKRPRPFLFKGMPAAREQATDCLATAAVYEAGADREGQRAVIQVVLNRVRSAGFPKTVCGVVYAGAERTTGCQFSFTCDGSLQRRPEHRGWRPARDLARRALAGAIFARVGRSTHYHTDWVAPGWSRTLDKVAKIHSHIFYQPNVTGRLGV
jgi:spore germination cell wall hydrolase CwlJ-like protein